MNEQTRIRPGVRLGLTVLLGLLGVWLDPGKLNDRLHTLEDPGGLGLAVWLAAVFVAVLILHRAEGVRTPWRLALFMVPALALSCYGVVVRLLMHGDMIGILYYSAIVFLLLAAGIWVYGWPRRREDKWHLGVCLVRAPAIALTAFLMLIAAGLRRASRPSMRTGLTRMAFIGFLIVIAAGSPINEIIRDLLGRNFIGLPRWLYDACFFFSLWAAIGCGVLYLLSPWPENPRLGRAMSHSRRYRMRVAKLGGFLAVALGLLAIVDPGGLGHIIGYALIGLCVTWPYVLIFLMLTPWPAIRWLPMMDDLPAGDGIGPFLSLLLLAIPLAPLSASFWRLREKFLAMFNGRLFADPFDRNIPGWALDQSYLSTLIWRFTLLTVMVLAYLVVVRWVSERRSRLGYWAFTLPAGAIWFFLMSFMLIIHGELLRYIHAMGFTIMRIYGLGYGLLYCVLMLGFLSWAVKKQVPAAGSSGGDGRPGDGSGGGRAVGDQAVDAQID